MDKFNLFSSSVSKWRSVLLLAFVSIVAISCSDDDDNPAPVTPTELDNIVALAQGTNDLSTLVAVLTKFPDLVSTLSADGKFTVFAPTNAAFTSLLSAIGQTSADNVPEEVLKRILQYHVISSGALKSTDLTDGQTAATILSDNNITVGVSGSSVTINGANVSTANIEAKNGIIHIVDAVLVPALEASIVNTVVAPAYFNKDFTTLTAAVVKADLLNTLISGSADYTIFAPTNAAFTAAGITELPSAEALAPILQYHVLNSEVLAKDLPETGSAITTLNGDFYLSKNTNGVFINGSTKVVSTDIVEGNGVVHVLDNVLMPASQNIVQIAVAASEAMPEAEFGQLVAALTAVENDPDAPNLISALSSASGAYTVFAPSDAAFQALYNAVGDKDGDMDADINDLVVAAGGLGTIATVLQYHVLSGRVFSTDIPNALDGNSSVTLTPLAGGTFTLNSTLSITDTDGALNLGTTDAKITGTDILATNGVIHTIDQVILP